MKPSRERWWNDTERAKTDVLGGNPVPVPLFSTTNLTWTELRSNLALRGESQAKALASKDDKNLSACLSTASRFTKEHWGFFLCSQDSPLCPSC